MLRPVRTTSPATTTGSVLTGPRKSRLSRSASAGPLTTPPASRSASRTTRAAGGPPCWDRGDHGPIVASVGCQVRGSPVGRKKLSLTRGTLAGHSLTA